MVGKARESKSAGEKNEDSSGSSYMSGASIEDGEMGVREKLANLLRRRRGKGLLPRDVRDTANGP